MVYTDLLSPRCLQSSVRSVLPTGRTFGVLLENIVLSVVVRYEVEDLVLCWLSRVSGIMMAGRGIWVVRPWVVVSSRSCDGGCGCFSQKESNSVEDNQLVSGLW